MNRPLSTFERVFWLLDRAVSQNFVMIARVFGTVRESHLRQALDILQSIHPPLNARFKEGDPPGFTDGAPPIPIRLLERKDDDHWQKVAEEEMLNPFPWTTGPMMRAILLHSENCCDLLMTFCHITADALSGVKCVEIILSYMAKLDAGEAVEPGPPLKELPSTFDLLRKNLPFGDSPEQGEDNAKAVQPAVLQPDADAPPDKRITRVIQRVLSPGDARKLLSRCRKEKTSIHAALCAALLQTAVEKIQVIKEDTGSAILMGCTTPVNVRHLFDRAIGDDIGNFISDALHFQTVDANVSLWEVARDVRTEMKKELSLGNDVKALRDIGGLLEIASTPEAVLKVVDKTLPPILVTNLGQLEIAEHFGSLRLDQLHFVASINPASSGGLGLAVSGFRGMIILNFLYLEPYFSPERATLIVNRTVERILEASE